MASSTTTRTATSPSNERFAPGWPGIEPRWTSSAKSGVGTALGTAGRVWFTLSHGILNEVYYPRMDQACVRDLGLLVSDGVSFFSEEKRDARHEVVAPIGGVPAFILDNTCPKGRYRIRKEVVADPKRDVILQRIHFDAPEGHRLFALLAPHLGNRGDHNTAWVGEYKGMPMLFAERDGVALALACSSGWSARSVGFVGTSDGWQDVSQHFELRWSYQRAENGNVALAGEIDLSGTEGTFVLALGFGRTANEAGHRVKASLQQQGFDEPWGRYSEDWSSWQRTLLPLDEGNPLYRTSTAVLRTHESRSFPGGIIASLSVPWGFSKGDDDLGGYHLVWPRDLVESAGGLLAAGAGDDMLRILDYLATTQEAEGRWPQNMWLDGTPYWGGTQNDEAAFPILLVDLARREGVLDDAALAQLWPMVRKAACFLARTGPVTPQDRWEEDAGYSPFTLAVEIAALLCAAELAEGPEPALAEELRATADVWNANIERWTYVMGTDLAHQVGVQGYYVRIAPPGGACELPIKNRPQGEAVQSAAQTVSPDALALVRFGLRAADDPRILDTVKVIDAVLRVQTPVGPAWRRYNGDGYGEHEDGAPFDGTGVGRPWPLLTAERAHYEIAAGNLDAARALMRTLEAFASEGGLLPEQVWDGDALPDRELFRGRPSGSAMPLVWAHAEYVKLCRSLADRRVFDTPPQTVARYLEAQR